VRGRRVGDEEETPSEVRGASHDARMVASFTEPRDKYPGPGIQRFFKASIVPRQPGAPQWHTHLRRARASCGSSSVMR
jgi:hypothetical protein